MQFFETNDYQQYGFLSNVKKIFDGETKEKAIVLYSMAKETASFIAESLARLAAFSIEIQNGDQLTEQFIKDHIIGKNINCVHFNNFRIKDEATLRLIEKLVNGWEAAASRRFGDRNYPIILFSYDESYTGGLKFTKSAEDHLGEEKMEQAQIRFLKNSCHKWLGMKELGEGNYFRSDVGLAPGMWFLMLTKMKNEIQLETRKQPSPSPPPPSALMDDASNSGQNLQTIGDRVEKGK